MSERHIRRLLILGMTVEVLAAIVGAYVALCALIQIGAWVAERIPMWAIPPMIVSVPLIGIVAMAWDSARSADGEDEENGEQSRFDPADRS